MNENEIAQNIQCVREKIARAAEKSGRNPASIALMAVTKTQAPEVIKAAWNSGLRLFGENRVQEAMAKFHEKDVFIPASELHMIGTLQKNKVNKALHLFDAIESIDSIELLDAILARIGSRTKPLDLFLELHTGEESKTGFPDLDALLFAVEKIAQYVGQNSPNNTLIRLKGLMTMAPFTSDTTAIRSSFQKLAAAFEEIKKRFELPFFKELSMGMSNDFEIAIEEGSTIVRIGTAIFGKRGEPNVL